MKAGSTCGVLFHVLKLKDKLLVEVRLGIGLVSVNPNAIRRFVKLLIIYFLHKPIVFDTIYSCLVAERTKETADNYSSFVC